MGYCLGAAVVGIVERRSALPSAALTPSLRHLQTRLFQKQQLIHQSLRKPLQHLGMTSSLEYHT